MLMILVCGRLQEHGNARVFRELRKEDRACSAWPSCIACNTNNWCSALVKANLYTRSQHYIASCNAATATRSDEACQWIIVEEAFEDWAYGAPGVLTMYGVAGCGKTAIASYVAEYLSTESKSPVLVSYCTEQATDKERHILCSLTYQLLQSEVELKAKFQEWSGARQAELREPPSNKPEKLWPFLGEALQDSKIQVFIVLDGLDECAPDVRCRLLTRFRDLIRRGASLKVFLSSRQRNDILKTLDGSATTIKNSPTEQPGSQIPLFHIDMKPNEERDRLLAKHLVSLHMAQDLEDKTRDLVIEQLTKGAGGSAIWLKMAMASLANDVTSAKNEYGVMRCLEFLQTSPKLVDWYQRLLSRVEDLEYHWINDLERALETLAVAKRPLTIGELSHAVLIDGDADDNNGSDNDEDDNDRDSPSLLNKAAKSADLLDNLLDVLRPFVVSLDDSFGETKNISVRLVHASLRDLLLAARPSQWKGIVAEARPRRLTKKELKQRIHELNGLLMGKCVKYLLLRDTEAKFPSEETHKSSDCESQDAQGDDEAGSEFGIDAMFVEPEVQKRVRAHALVSHLPFYDYAASHWAIHFAASGNSVQSELRDSARALLDVSTDDCIQWVSFVRAEKEATAEAFPSSSEAATLAAYYGLTVALSDILAEKSVLQSTKDEAILWASHQGHDRVVKLLLQNDADATKSKLDGRTALTVAAHRGHVDCVRALLADQRTDANVKDSNGRTALWLAANSGHEQICTILLNREDCRPDAQDRRQQTPLFGAIGAGHLSIIRLLAAHPGVNVNHKDKAGRTALSCAAGFGDIISLTQLLNVKDVDVNLPDKDGKSPLIWAASKGQAACVDALLQNGNTDKTASNHCKDGKNAYHYACNTGTPGEHAALLCLLKHDLPGRDDPDSAGWTPLMWAVGSGPVAFTRTLLAAGPVELERRDHNGRTALSLAAEWGSPSVDIVEVLLRHGASPETKDNEGKTPWDFATKKERFVIASRISSWINKQ